MAETPDSAGQEGRNTVDDRDNGGSLTDSYRNLMDLWTSGVRDYHSLLSSYLTANSIFVAAIGFLLGRQPVTLMFTFLVVTLCSFGILMALQMAIVLGRFSSQNALWEWQLRGIENAASWTQRKLFHDLHEFRDHRHPLEDKANDPPIFYPTWAIRQHRQWWVHRDISFPLFFGIIYTLFLTWGFGQFLGGYLF